MIRHHQLAAQRLNATSEILWLWEVLFQLVPATKPLTATTQKEINSHLNAKDRPLFYMEVACVPHYKKGIKICLPSMLPKLWAQQLSASFPSQMVLRMRVARWLRGSGRRSRAGLASLLVRRAAAQRGLGSLLWLQARHCLWFAEWGSDSSACLAAITAPGAFSIFMDMNPALIPEQLQGGVHLQCAKCLRIITPIWKTCSMPTGKVTTGSNRLSCSAIQAPSSKHTCNTSFYSCTSLPRYHCTSVWLCH